MGNARVYHAAAAGILGGTATSAEIGAVSADAQQFVRWAAIEGLAGLLHRSSFSSSASSSSARGMPDGLSAGLRQAALRQAAIIALQEQELGRVLTELARAAVFPILLKGAALAYTVYGEPALRPRSDTDLLIREDDEPRARLALERLGYDRERETSGQLVTSQFHYTRSDLNGVRHACDVHVKIANALAYANRLSYQELRDEAVPLPRLHRDALGPSAVHSLLIACMHRIAHHRDEPGLLWLYDIHLLAGALGELEWDRAACLARTKSLSAIVQRGLERSDEAFGPAQPGEIVRRFREAARHEPPPPLFDTTTRTVDVVLSDFAALSGRGARLQLLREHLFPPFSYMRQLYAGCPRALLPLAYAYRIVRGAPKWFRLPRPR